VSDIPCPDNPTPPPISTPSGVLRSFSWLGAGVLLSRLLQFVTIVYLTRVLGDAAFGRFAFATAFVWYGVIGVDFGLGTIGTREVARRPDRLPPLARSIIALRLLVFAAEMILLLCVLSALRVDLQTHRLFVYSFLSLLAYAINPDWIFRGIERMQYVAVWEALPRAIWLAASIALVHSQADLTRVPLARAGGEIAVTMLLLAIAWHLRPGSRPKLGLPDIRAARSLIVEAAPIGLAALLGQIYYGFDTILLGVLRTDQAVGQYSAAYRIVTLLLTGSFLLAATYQPVLARTFAADRTAFAHHLRRLSGCALLAGVVLPAIVAIGAVPIVRLLYGRAFVPAAVPLAILMGSVPFACLGAACSTALVAAGRQKQMLIGTAVGAIGNIAMNVLLIPPLGMVGAAIATVLSYAAAWAVQWWYVQHRVGRIEPIPMQAASEMISGVFARLGGR
jgi:O-antigen/teichoic acid export membrane protein